MNIFFAVVCIINFGSFMRGAEDTSAAALQTAANFLATCTDDDDKPSIHSLLYGTTDTAALRARVEQDPDQLEQFMPESLCVHRGAPASEDSGRRYLPAELTPAAHAAYLGKSNALAVLLDLKANPNAQSKAPASGSYFDLADLLYENQYHTGLTLLHFAITSTESTVEPTSRLTEEIPLEDDQKERLVSSGRADLVDACRSRKVQNPLKLPIIALLLKAKADPCIKDDKGCDAFWYAEGNDAVLKLLGDHQDELKKKAAAAAEGAGAKG